MGTAFHAAHDGGADYDFVIASLAAIFKNQGVIPPAKAFAKQLPVPTRPLGLIFGRPTCKIFRDELLPDRGYYNLRSGANIEFFYMGYANPDAEYLSVGHFDDNDFSETFFVSAVEDFEERTSWRYSGQSDLILLNSFFTPKQAVRLDFRNVFAIQLEDAVDSRLIKSGKALLEDVMRTSREYPSEDVVMKISDVVFLRSARQSFLSCISFDVTPLKVRFQCRVFGGANSWCRFPTK